MDRTSWKRSKGEIETIMFTGIITDLGRIRAAADEVGGARRFEIETGFDMDAVEIGASIACAGACLTVTEKGKGWFAALASAETLAKTTLGSWQIDARVNLERALALGQELGGHLVSGHVDGVAHLVAADVEGGSKRLSFEVPSTLARFIAPKGSVTLDGVSLTVNEVSGAVFGVNVIPHTLEATTLGGLGVGDAVNLEIDLLARYVARLLENPLPKD